MPHRIKITSSMSKHPSVKPTCAHCLVYVCNKRNIVRFHLEIRIGFAPCFERLVILFLTNTLLLVRRRLDDLFRVMEERHLVHFLAGQSAHLRRLDFQPTSSAGPLQLAPVRFLTQSRRPVNANEKITDPVPVLAVSITAAPGSSEHRLPSRLDRQPHLQDPVAILFLVGFAALRNCKIIVSGRQRPEHFSLFSPAKLITVHWFSFCVV